MIKTRLFFRSDTDLPTQNFEYSGLKTDKKTLSDNGIVNISFNIRNTGNYDSDEVVQLYVSFPDSKVERPAKLSRDLPGSLSKREKPYPLPFG